MVKNINPQLKPDEQDKRKEVRVNTVGKLYANCRIISAESAGKCNFAALKIRNISNSGAQTYCREDILKDTMLFLNIDLDVLKKTIGVIGKVMWCKQSGIFHSAGISFCLWPETKDKETVKQYVGLIAAYEDKDKKQNPQSNKE